MSKTNRIKLAAAALATDYPDVLQAFLEGQGYRHWTKEECEDFISVSLGLFMSQAYQDRTFLNKPVTEPIRDLYASVWESILGLQWHRANDGKPRYWQTIEEQDWNEDGSRRRDGAPFQAWTDLYVKFKMDRERLRRLRIERSVLRGGDFPEGSLNIRDKYGPIHQVKNPVQAGHYLAAAVRNTISINPNHTWETALHLELSNISFYLGHGNNREEIREISSNISIAAKALK